MNETHPYVNSGAAVWLSNTDVMTAIEAGMSNAFSLPEVAIGFVSGGMMKQAGKEEPNWFGEGRFSAIRVYDTQHQGHAASQGGLAATRAELLSALAQAKTPNDAGAAILKALISKLARAMMMDDGDVNPERPANAYGVDSLVAVEIRAWVFKEVKSDVSVFEILSNASLIELANKIAANSSLLSASNRMEENLVDS